MKLICHVKRDTPVHMKLRVSTSLPSYCYLLLLQLHRFLRLRQIFERASRDVASSKSASWIRWSHKEIGQRVGSFAGWRKTTVLGRSGTRQRKVFTIFMSTRVKMKESNAHSLFLDMLENGRRTKRLMRTEFFDNNSSKGKKLLLLR